jgi:hypothetical protein
MKLAEPTKFSRKSGEVEGSAVSFFQLTQSRIRIAWKGGFAL